MTKSPASAVSVPSAFAPARSRWTVAWRLPLARFSSLRVSAQRTGSAGALRQLGGDERVLAGMVLRAEAAAHVVADDPHVVLRDPELLGGLLAHAPDELRGGVQVEDVPFPLADRLVRLHRVVQDGLRPVLGLDHDVGLGEALLDVARARSARARRSATPSRPPPPGRGAARRTSHSTSTSSRAASAWSSVSAAIAATAAPGYAGLAREDVEVVRARERRARRAPRPRATGRASSRAHSHAGCAGRRCGASPGAGRRPCRRPRRGRARVRRRAQAGGRRSRAGRPATGRTGSSSTTIHCSV